MAKYASTTDVSSARSRAEIETTLSRYGATGFMYGWNAGEAMLGFEMQARRIIFRLPMPARSEFELSPTGRPRSDSAIDAAWEQAQRQRWRALALVIKAKLEAVESGISVFEDEFMAHIALPNGTTVGQFMRPQIEQAYRTGQMPPLLQGPKQESDRRDR